MDPLKKPEALCGAAELFSSLLSGVESTNALSHYKGPDPVSLNSFLYYGGESVLVKVRRIAAGLNALATQKKLLSQLQDAFKDITDDKLSDPENYFPLQLATSMESMFSPPPIYNFVGRSFVNKFLSRIRSMAKSVGVLGIRYRGPPGRGKSYVLAATAGHLTINFPDVPVVYVLCQRFTSSSFEHLQKALLLAFWRDRNKQVEILGSATTEDLVTWCKQQPRLLFLIDEADYLDNYKETAAASKEQREAARHNLMKAAASHSAVWCGSQRATLLTYKPTPKIEYVELEAPFDEDEVSTWLIANEGRTQVAIDTAKELLYFTGYVPRLLHSYLISGKQVFKKDVDEMLKCFKLDSLQQSVIDMLEQLLAGAPVPREVVDVFPSLLYIDPSEDDDDIEKSEDNIRICCCCPYMERIMRDKLTEHRKNIIQSAYLNKIHRWTKLIQTDIHCHNSARMGWRVEGLVIDCLQACQTLDSITFRHSRTFNVGEEHTTLNSCEVDELKDGILFSPMQYNANSVLIKLDDGLLQVIGIQITVAAWKLKEEKNSHGVWLKDMAKCWALDSRREVPQEARFIYILSDDLRASKASQKGTFKVLKFSEVHPSLELMDDLNLPEPAELMQCQGVNESGQRCNRCKIQVTDDYYCPSHKPKRAAQKPGAGSSKRPKGSLD